MKKLLFVMLMCIVSITLYAQSKVHTVQRGETVASVAKKYGVSVDDLKKANPNINNYFYVGMTLTIPQRQVNTLIKTDTFQDEGSDTNKNDEYSLLNEKNQKKRLDPSDYSHFGIFYTAPFKAIDYGIVGFIGNAFGIGRTGFGGTLSIGWQFKGITSGGGCAKFGLGPNYCYPISEHVYIYVPLCADLYYTTTGGTDGSKFSFGVELIPSLGLKYGKFSFTGGFYLGWVQGSSTVTPGMSVSVAWEL